METMHIFLHHDVNVNIRSDANTEHKLDAILQKLQIIELKENKLMADLSTLEADVASNGDAVASAVTLLNGLKAALDAAGTDPIKLDALRASLEANTSSLAAAVVANTPAV
jgi:hypothetical protein